MAVPIRLLLLTKLYFELFKKFIYLITLIVIFYGIKGKSMFLYNFHCFFTLHLFMRILTKINIAKMSVPILMKFWNVYHTFKMGCVIKCGSIIISIMILIFLISTKWIYRYSFFLLLSGVLYINLTINLTDWREKTKIHINT